MKVTAAIIVLATSLPIILAKCCPRQGVTACDVVGGTCNIFCCNCSGHCAGTKRNILSDFTKNEAGLDSFAVASAGGNTMNVDQFLAFLQVEGDVAAGWVARFHKFDTNGDGLISEDEAGQGF